MRSRPARLTLSALAWIVLGAAALFTVHAQQQIDHRRTALRAFETTARDGADALDDAQAGLQAYVSIGQEPSEWEPKVSTYLQTASASVDTLRASAHSQPAGPALLDASTAVTQIGNIEKRVRQHIAAENVRSAADAVFADAADSISSAVSDIDTAITAEQRAADAFESGQRRLQIYATGGAAGFAALVLALLGFASPAARESKSTESDEAGTSADIGGLAGLSLQAPVAAVPPPPVSAAPDYSEALKTVASICTEFGRLRDAGQLKPLIEQAADAMNARGVIVWLGSTAGADLRPVLAHGYSDATLARIGTVARSADNVAAMAYRTGAVQIVKSRPGASQGAIVAPLMAVDGCIGALTAEIRDRGEDSEATRSIALILAAQLAGVLAAAASDASEGGAAPAEQAAAPQARTAAG